MFDRTAMVGALLAAGASLEARNGSEELPTRMASAPPIAEHSGGPDQQQGTHMLCYAIPCHATPRQVSLKMRIEEWKSSGTWM